MRSLRHCRIALPESVTSVCYMHQTVDSLDCVYGIRSQYGVLRAVSGVTVLVKRCTRVTEPGSLRPSQFIRSTRPWLHAQSVTGCRSQYDRQSHDAAESSTKPSQPSLSLRSSQVNALCHHLHSTLWIALLHIRSLSVYSQYSLRSSKLIEIHFPISSFDIYIADLIYWPCANRKKHLAEIRKWHIR